MVKLKQGLWLENSVFYSRLKSTYLPSFEVLCKGTGWVLRCVPCLGFHWILMAGGGMLLPGATYVFRCAQQLDFFCILLTLLLHHDLVGQLDFIKVTWHGLTPSRGRFEGHSLLLRKILTAKMHFCGALTWCCWRCEVFRLIEASEVSRTLVDDKKSSSTCCMAKTHSFFSQFLKTCKNFTLSWFFSCLFLNFHLQGEFNLEERIGRVLRE